MSPSPSTTHSEGAMPPPEDAVVELVSRYFAGALDDVEASDVEARLKRGDEALRAAMRELGDSVLALGLSLDPHSVEPAPPAPHLRERILRRTAERTVDAPRPARTQVWRGWSADRLNEGLFTLRADDTPWEETGVEGVQVRRLFVDRPNNRMTAMFKMAPGSEYPDHLHDGVEECYVLQGELRVGDDLTMRAGDYQRAESGSHHGRQWTTTGCVILVSSSLSDEIVD